MKKSTEATHEVETLNPEALQDLTFHLSKAMKEDSTGNGVTLNFRTSEHDEPYSLCLVSAVLPEDYGTEYMNQMVALSDKLLREAMLQAAADKAIKEVMGDAPE